MVRYFISVKSTTHSHLGAICDSGRLSPNNNMPPVFPPNVVNARMLLVVFACFISCMQCFLHSKLQNFKLRRNRQQNLDLLQGTYSFWKSGKAFFQSRNLAFFQKSGIFDDTIFFFIFSPLSALTNIIKCFSLTFQPTFLYVCFLLIHTLGGKWRPFQKDIIYYSNVSGKGSKILEKSGNSVRTKCRYPDYYSETLMLRFQFDHVTLFSIF